MKRTTIVLGAIFMAALVSAAAGRDSFKDYSNCLECHEGRFDEMPVHFIENNGDCHFCHGISVTETGHDVFTVKSNSLCQSCHIDIDDNLLEGPNHRTLLCIRCHNPHGSDNVYSFNETVIELCTNECHVEEKLGLSHPIGQDIVDKNTETELTCISSCHSNHQPQETKLLQLASLDLCDQCHHDKF